MILMKPLSLHKKVIELRPKYIDAYKALGVLYLKMGRFDELVETIKQAIEIEKDDYQLFYIISSALMAKKEDVKP